VIATGVFEGFFLHAAIVAVILSFSMGFERLRFTLCQGKL